MKTKDDKITKYPNFKFEDLDDIFIDSFDMKLLEIVEDENAKVEKSNKGFGYVITCENAKVEVFDDNTLMKTGFDLTDLELELEEQIISAQELNEKEARELRDKIDLNRDFTGHKVQYVMNDEWFENIGHVWIEFPLGIEYDGYEENWSLTYFPVGNKLVLETYGYESVKGTNEIFTLTE